MRISSKGRYALAAMIKMAQYANTDECMTILSISEKLGISKIYLEQVYSLLKRAGLVISVKGAYGGYKLAKSTDKITVFDVLTAAEQTLFEATEESVAGHAEDIEKAMQDAVFSVIDEAIAQKIKNITLQDLVTKSEGYKTDGGFMFYI